MFTLSIIAALALLAFLILKKAKNTQIAEPSNPAGQKAVQAMANPLENLSESKEYSKKAVLLFKHVTLREAKLFFKRFDIPFDSSTNKDLPDCIVISDVPVIYTIAGGSLVVFKAIYSPLVNSDKIHIKVTDQNKDTLNYLYSKEHEGHAPKNGFLTVIYSDPIAIPLDVIEALDLVGFHTERSNDWHEGSLCLEGTVCYISVSGNNVNYDKATGRFVRLEFDHLLSSANTGRHNRQTPKSYGKPIYFEYQDQIKLIDQNLPELSQIYSRALLAMINDNVVIPNLDRFLQANDLSVKKICDAVVFKDFLTFQQACNLWFFLHETTKNNPSLMRYRSYYEDNPNLFGIACYDNTPRIRWKELYLQTYVPMSHPFSAPFNPIVMLPAFHGIINPY